MKDESKGTKRVVLPPNRAWTEMAVGNSQPTERSADNQRVNCPGGGCSDAGKAKKGESGKK